MPTLTFISNAYVFSLNNLECSIMCPMCPMIAEPFSKSCLVATTKECIGRRALTPIGAVEVLGAFDLAAGPHV